MKEKQKGLGDTIAAFTQATKLDMLAKKVANLTGKEDCGCAKRKEALNNLVPYKSKVSFINVVSQNKDKS